MVDAALIAAWRLFDLESPRLSLVAVGGYGRGELHPYSDVDLLILSAEEPAEADCRNLEHFVAFLWDIGLEIGHSVRTLQHCAQLAEKDITVATNIMESRTLAGPESLRDELEKRTGPNRSAATRNTTTPNTTWNRTSRTPRAACGTSRWWAG